MRFAVVQLIGMAGAISATSTRTSGDPAPVAISPSTASVGQNITVTGTDLLRSGYIAELQYTKKYRATTSESAIGVIAATSQTATALVFPTTTNMLPTGLKLRYHAVGKTGTFNVLTTADTGFLSRAPFAIPGRLDVLEAPVVVAGNLGVWIATNASGQLVSGPMILPGTVLLTGKNLVPTPGGTVTVTIAGTTIQQSAAARYDPTGDGGRGIDVLTLQVAEPGTNTIGDIVATTTAGSGTKANAWLVRRPRVTGVDEINSFGSVIAAANGRLIRGHRYQIRGTDFAVPATPPLFSISHARLAGIDLRGNDTTIDATHMRFLVPTTITAGSGLLEVVSPTGIGSGGGGTFTITDPGAAPPPIADVVLAPSPATWGSVLTATVAFAGSIAPGADVGTVVVTSPSGGDFTGLPITVPISANPQTISIPSKLRSTTTTKSLRFRLSRASGGTDSVDRNVQLVSPTITGLVISPSSVAAGSTANAILSFDFPNGGASASCSSFLSFQPDLAVSVQSSDTAVTVFNPAIGGSSSICVTSNPTSVQLNAGLVSSLRTVTITAQLGPSTKTATMTVTAPSLVAVKANRASLTSMQSAVGTLVLDGPMTNAAALLSSSDPSVSVPAKLPIGSGLNTNFSITTLPVSSARNATISAAVNGVTQSMTIALSPLQISSVTPAPASVRAGSNAAVTVALNANIDLPFSIALASSDPSAVTVPATLQFAAGQNAAVFSAQTISPQAQQKTVTITATYSVTLPNGTVVTTSKSGTLTVTP